MPKTNTKEKLLRENYKRELRLFVQRLIKMAKEQIVVGRNYGWTQDSMVEEMHAFIETEKDLSLTSHRESVLEEVEEIGNKEIEKSKTISIATGIGIMVTHIRKLKQKGGRR